MYVKGVGEGKGVVTETTNLLACEAMALGVIVKYCLIFLGTEVDPDTLELQAATNKMHRSKIFRMR